MLVLHGAEDPMCRIEGSAAFHGGLQVPGSSVRGYPALRHEIFNEPEREQVFADVLEWIERTLRRDEQAAARPRAASA
jgi:alpha-beta hydrolase superfamily lysophospholipase